MAELEPSSDVASYMDNYDVFINFRGADTRQGFAYRLYDCLKAEGIRVFLDDEELNYGKRLDEELPQAINNSKIYITVISESYATSKWCLRELAEIVRNKQEFKDKKEILPVFYKIKAEDVKLKTDLFKSQLDTLKEKVAAETVEAWAEALKGIPNLKAWTVPIDGGYKEDGECCREIVKRVSIILRVKHKPLSKDLIGMEDLVKEVMQLFNIGNPGFQVIGIHGMGGSGKTTLAKAVYNKLCDDKFNCCCFMPDVRESLDEDKGSNGCLELQKKLLKEVSNCEDLNKITDADDAVRRIQLTLQGKKVLLVFDDVSKSNQIERVIGDNYTMLGGGSRVIITTRDDRVLRNRKFAEFTKIHEMKAMENEHALELFSWHAFGLPIPPEEYSSLSNDAVSLTGRLPLSLEITGSLFFVGGRNNWNQTVEKLKKMPNKEVQERLKISYEDLEEGTKEIFLDIACFFVDEEISHELDMWDACGFFPELAIQELISMCLIKIEEDATSLMHQLRPKNKYWMHDHIKDVGREIVRQEGPEDKEQRSRIWKKNDSIDILRSRKKENNIKGILLEDLETTDVDDEIWTVRAENFVNLDKLRFLHLVAKKKGFLEGEDVIVQMKGSFKHILPNLRMLSLPRMKMKRFRATNFNLKKLVVLNLSESNITTGWAGSKQFKDLLSLEVLNLSDCQGLRKTPDLSICTSLKKLSLAWCTNLKEIDGSITSLPKLRHLDLSYCLSLKKLPDSIGELVELEVLVLNSCGCLVSLPNSLTTLPKLQILDVSCCTRLESLPDSVGETMVLQLTKLDISFCKRLKKLPGFISKQKRLEVLQTEVMKKLEGIPSEIEDLHCLREMSFLRSSISGLPSLVKLTRLEKLSLMYCDHLQQLPAELPTSLVELHVSSTSLQSIPDYSYLIHLTELTFSLYGSRGDLGELQELNLSWIWRLSELKELVLNISESFTTTIESEEFSSASLVSQLEDLTLSCSFSGTCVVMPSFLSALTKLKISLIKGTTSLSLPRLNRLTHFNLSDSGDLEQILGLGELESLISLEIKRCEKLRVIHVLPGESLESLGGPSESETKVQDYTGRLEHLTELDISYCPNLKDFPGQQTLQSLKKLSVVSCRSMFAGVSNFATFPNLEQISIFGCKGAVEITGLGELKFLGSLQIAFCDSLKRMNIEGPKPWSYFYLYDCGNLEDIGSCLDHLDLLRRLYINDCPQLELPKLPSGRMMINGYVEPISR